MSYGEAVDYLLAMLGDIRAAHFGLERMTALVERLGRPERRYRIVHVAGTNGKGSTAAMIEAGLRAAGWRTGLYTSPHLSRFNERFRIGGEPIDDAGFARAVTAVAAASEALVAGGGRRAQPTMFEMVTAAAFWAFAEAGAERVVVEVGLGGRLDATNVVQPEVAVVTPIDLDHEAWLGAAAESIAAEKAGILKSGSRAVFAAQPPAAAAVLMARAAELDLEVRRAGRDWAAHGVVADERGFYRFNAMPTAGEALSVSLGLAGEHQVDNGLTALCALEAAEVPREAAARGLQHLSWPGRLEWVQRDPDVLLDAAHNPAGARTLANYLKRFCAGRPIHLIYGASRDKAVEESAALLFPAASRVTLTAAHVSRSVSPAALAAVVDHHHSRIQTAPTVETALGRAHREAARDELIVVAGSIFLTGEARELLLGGLLKG